MNKLKYIRYATWAIIALVLVIGLMWLQSRSIETNKLSPELAAIGGDFLAQDQNGKTVNAHDLQGKPTLMFFGFTFCPDVCPTTLVNMSRWLEKLDKRADGLNVVFVTLDPKRDTPVQMQQYLTSFDPHIQGWVPAEADLPAIAKAYRLYFEKTGSGDDYLINHTADIYLFNRAGQFTGTISPQEDDQTAFEKIELMLKIT